MLIASSRLPRQKQNVISIIRPLSPLTNVVQIMDRTTFLDASRSSIEALTARKPNQAKKNIQIRPAVPPLRRPIVDIPRAVSQLHKRIIEKPKIDMNRKLRWRARQQCCLECILHQRTFNSCGLPIQYISFRSSIEPVSPARELTSLSSSTSHIMPSSFTVIVEFSVLVKRVIRSGGGSADPSSR